MSWGHSVQKAGGFLGLELRGAFCAIDSDVRIASIWRILMCDDPLCVYRKNLTEGQPRAEPAEAPGVWNRQKENHREAGEGLTRGAGGKPQCGCCSPTKEHFKNKGVVSSVVSSSRAIQGEMSRAPIGSWYPWVEQTQRKVKGRGQCAMT